MSKLKSSNKENDAKLYKLDFKNQGISQKGTFGTKSKFKGGNLNKAAKQAGSNFKRYDQGNIQFSGLNKPIYEPKPANQGEKDTMGKYILACNVSKRTISHYKDAKD